MREFTLSRTMLQTVCQIRKMILKSCSRIIPVSDLCLTFRFGKFTVGFPSSLRNVSILRNMKVYIIHLDIKEE